MRLSKFSYLKLATVGVLVTGIGVSYAMSNDFSMKVTAIASSPLSQPKPATNPSSDAGTTAAGTIARAAGSPMCKPGTYNKPAAPAASSADPGLHVNLQANAYYTIYGHTTDEINDQMAACTPVNDELEGRFAASTDWSLNWAFDYTGGADGLCHVTAASVSMNIGMIFPAWQQTAGTAAGVDGSWQRFIANLKTHENGHLQLDQSGATRLLADLQNFPATSCDTIVAQATAKADSNIRTLNQANADYDSATDHGETQGAVLN